METRLKTQQVLSGNGWLPSDETWTYASADSPTFTFTIGGDKTSKYSVGMRLKLTQTTVKYFIITNVVYSSPNTTITIYGGTDYTLANATISDTFYSYFKSPHGFPMSTAKWQVLVTSTANNISQSNPTGSTWYNLGSVGITVPIGVWDLSYQTHARIDGSSGLMQLWTTLSTSNSTESDVLWTNYYLQNLSTLLAVSSYKCQNVTLTSKTAYYLLHKSAGTSVTNLSAQNQTAGTIIRAVCSYL